MLLATSRDLINQTSPSTRRSLYSVSTFRLRRLTVTDLSTRIWPRRCRTIVSIGGVNFVAVTGLASSWSPSNDQLPRKDRQIWHALWASVDFPRRLFRRNAGVRARLYPPAFILHDLLFRTVASLPAELRVPGAILLSASYKYDGEISAVVDDDPSISRKKSRLSSYYSLEASTTMDRIDTNGSTKKSTNRSKISTSIHWRRYGQADFQHENAYFFAIDSGLCKMKSVTPIKGVH